MAGRPGRGSAATGRPRGSGDMVPSDQLPAKVAELLDTYPAVTIATVTDTLGIAYATAQRALTRLRGERLADRMQAQPELGAGEAEAQLGYPTVLHRAVTEAAGAVRRARAVRPYLQRVADHLAAEGWAEPAEVEVQLLDGGYPAAALQLTPAGPVLVLAWDARWGWRTSSRRHPLGKDTGLPPEGDGIRYLGHALQPGPDDLVAELADRRRGSKRPRAEAPAAAGQD
ncbi:hypothetical protein ACFV98_17960 [Streptomyces violascens]|uniref:hypothetical protein n=1 Tax=Streptomyces violascens TaxID=67381 RepID=UPI0036468705